MDGDRDLGVALSGGGHRATVFALGALLALRDLGLHRRVTSISSVSGGSIANGAVMVGPDYGTADDDEVDAYVDNLVARVAERGVLLGGAPATRWYLRSFAVACAAALLGLLVLLGSVWVDRPAGPSLVGLLLTVLGLAAAWLLFGQRSTRTERAIDQELLGGRGLTLDSQRTRNLSVHHVICTTELQSGDSFFFSDRLVYGYAFGGSTQPCGVPVSTPVQASACVPGAFRARRISLDTLGLRPVAVPDHGPVDSIVCCDGGVYDNMADEWEYNYSGRLESFPALAHVQPNRASSLVVVNASGRWKGLEPIASGGLALELAGLSRSQSVQYDVSTGHRRRALFQLFTSDPDRRLNGTFVQIPDSPYRTVELWCPAPGRPVDAAGHRAEQARTLLDDWGIGEQAYAGMAAECAAVRTTLAPLGRRTTDRLLEHGYLLTAVQVFVILGLGDLDRLRARNRFLRLDRPEATR